MVLDELVHMSRVMRKALFEQLAAIEGNHKEFQGRLQGFRAARKTTRAARQASQIMAQFGVIRFNRVGVGFPLGDCIAAPVIPQVIIGIKRIAVIAFRLRSLIHQFLKGFLRPLPNDSTAQVTAGKPIYECDDEDLVFFSPIKLNNSSSSASLTWAGTGGSGNWAAAAWTHKETVRW